MSSTQKPPSDLDKDTAAWFSDMVSEWQMDSHDIRLLTLACRAWDRGEQARKALAKHGTTWTDRLGNVKLRPEVNIERDCRLAFARMIRQLDLNEEVTGPRLSRSA